MFAPKHPQRVRPSGSQLLDGAANLRDAGGLGTLAALPDAVLLQLLGMCSAETLLACAAASHALRAFSTSDDLWRAKVLEDLPAGKLLQYHSSWRRTYMALLRPDLVGWREATVVPSSGVLYSDALFWPWHCGTASLPPEWTSFQNITRVSAETLSLADFESTYEAAGVPVILTGLISRWPAFERWGLEALRTRLGETPFHVGGHEMTLGAFLDYAQDTVDEQVVLIFSAQAYLTARHREVRSRGACGRLIYTHVLLRVARLRHPLIIVSKCEPVPFSCLGTR